MLCKCAEYDHDKDLTPTESEQAKSKHGGTDLEDSREGREEGGGPGPGREHLHGHREAWTQTTTSQEAHERAELFVPCHHGRGKRKAEGG